VKQRKMDYHLHTTHSMDGQQSMEELCETMCARGVEEICITEHLETGHPDEGADIPPVWDVWLDEIRQMKQRYPQLDIRIGIEIGDNPACRDEIRSIVDHLPLDFRLLSLHLINNRDCYNNPSYFNGRTRIAAYREYVEAKLESALAWDDYDSFAHIGYVAKFSAYTGEERPLRYEDAPDLFDALLTAIISKGKCIEINTSGYRAMGEPLPHPSIIKRYIELGGDTFTFGSDSHNVERDYEDVERAKAFIRSLGGKYQASFKNREKTLYEI